LFLRIGPNIMIYNDKYRLKMFHF